MSPIITFSQEPNRSWAVNQINDEKKILPVPPSPTITSLKLGYSTVCWFGKAYKKKTTKPQILSKTQKFGKSKKCKTAYTFGFQYKIKTKTIFFFFYGIGKIWNKDKDRRRTIFEFVLVLLLVFGWVAQLGNEREGALWDFVRGFICNIYNKRSFFWMALVVASTWRSSLGRPISFRSLSMMYTCRRPYWRAVFFLFCNGHSGVWSFAWIKAENQSPKTNSFYKHLGPFGNVIWPLHGSRPKTKAQ